MTFYNCAFVQSACFLLQQRFYYCEKLLLVVLNFCYDIIQKCRENSAFSALIIFAVFLLVFGSFALICRDILHFLPK